MKSGLRRTSIRDKVGNSGGREGNISFWKNQCYFNTRNLYSYIVS